MKKLLAILLMTITVLGLTSCQPLKDIPLPETVTTETTQVTETDKVQDNKRYVTDYDLALKDSKKDPTGEWTIRKREDKTGIYIEIYHPGDKIEIKDYLMFWVFDSAEEAKAKYDALYKRSKKYSTSTWEEGENWFVSQEPDVYDAGIIWMNYLNGNVIIEADLDIWSEWPTEWTEEPEETTTTEPTKPKFNRYSLKDYVIENADQLKDFVLHKVLGDT